MRPAGAVSQVPRDAGSAIQSCCAQSTSSASGWKARRARSTCCRAAGSKRSSCQPKPVTSTRPSSAVSAYSQFRPGPMPTAMPCGSTPRASISTFTARPALAPAASARRGGSSGANEICGRQLSGTASTSAWASCTSPLAVVQTTPASSCSTVATAVPSRRSTTSRAIDSASALHPGSGPCARHVSSPVRPPCSWITASASFAAPSCGDAPPINCHHPSRKSRTASLGCSRSTYSAADSAASAWSPAATRSASSRTRASAASRVASSCHGTGVPRRSSPAVSQRAVCTGG